MMTGGQELGVGMGQKMACCGELKRRLQLESL